MGLQCINKATKDAKTFKVNFQCWKSVESFWKLRDMIFDQWTKLYFSLDAHPEIQILNGLYCWCHSYMNESLLRFKGEILNEHYLEGVLTKILFNHSHLSNKRGDHAYRFWKIPPSTKKNPPSTFIYFITKVSDIIAEPNFSHGHFEL
jgi:hypothetical protein